MHYLRLAFTLIAFIISGSAYAGVIKGRVTDEKGNPLPYATIYLEGTTQGVNANGNADYMLTVSPGLYKVVCQYIGFRQSTFNISINGAETVEHTFILKDQSLEMKEVVVHANAEDPAYRVIRNAIQKRKFHLDQVHSFQTSIYLKGVMRSRSMPDKVMGKKVKKNEMAVDSIGKGVLYLVEENTDYYSRGEKNKTIIHSVRESGNPGGLGISQLPQVITFYENNVDIFGEGSRGFISPISENALFYYKYKLLGEFTEHGRSIYKIKATQKRQYEPCFNGIIYIVDSDWAIHSLDMTLTKQSGMDMLDTMEISQIFLPLKKDTWVARSQVIYMTIKLFGFDITGAGVTVYSNQKVNEPIPDSIFADKIISEYDKTANKKDSSFWKDARPIPLETDEKKDFKVKDSIVKRINSPEYIDSIRRKNNRFKPLALLQSGETFNSKKYKTTYGINPILPLQPAENMVNYNIVEGLNIAPKLHISHFVDTGKTLYGEVAVRYGFSNAHFNAIGRLYYLARDRNFLNKAWEMGIECGKYVFQFNPDNSVPVWYNTYEALFARQNDLKIYERWEGSAFVRRNYGNGLNWFLRASYQRRMPLFNTTDYAFVKGSDIGFTNNLPPHLSNIASVSGENDAALVYASVSFTPGYTYTQYPDHKVANGSSWPKFTLTYQKGIPGILYSVSDFDKYKFSIQDDRRLRLLGTIKYNFAVGGFLNSNFVAIPDLMHLYGDRGIGFAAPYLESFQLAPYYDFSNKEPVYGEGHVEYHLNGLISNKIPLMRQARFYFVLGGNAFYARNTDYYAEAFVGIDNIGWKLIRILRIDFVQSWDSFMGHNSGIRFGLSLSGQGTQHASTNQLHTEW